MPISDKLLHEGDKGKSIEEDIATVHIERFPAQSPPGSQLKEGDQLPSYTETDTAETDLTAAFANLDISVSSNPVIPTPDLCLAHLKLLKTFQILKEDVGYLDGLFGLWDAPCELPIVEDHDKALVVIREKRWALYIARAVERFEDWWLKVLCKQERAEKLRQQDMNMKRGSDFMDFPKRGIAKVWSTSMLPPIGRVNVLLHSQRKY